MTMLGRMNSADDVVTACLPSPSLSARACYTYPVNLLLQYVDLLPLTAQHHHRDARENARDAHACVSQQSCDA